MGKFFRKKSNYGSEGSLVNKLSSSVLTVSLIVGAVLLVIALGLYSNALVDQYITESFGLARSAAVVADRIADTDALAIRALEAYKSIPENVRQNQFTAEYMDNFDFLEQDEDYQRLKRMLGRLRKNSDVEYLYFGVYDVETSSLLYICDPDEDPSTACLPGEWEAIGEEEMNAFTTWNGKGKLYDIGNTPRHGFMCTSGYPVGNTHDGVRAFILADVTLSGVAKGLRNLVLQYAVAVAVVMFLIGRRLNRKLQETVVSPLNRIGQAAQQYVKDRNAGITATDHFDRLEIHTGDEIEHLSIIMAGMEHDIGEHEAALVRLTSENERVRTEMDLAARIQMDMLPTQFPPFPDRNDFDIYAVMDPAKEVGGDFYDFFLIDDDHLALVMADVAGKGIPASLFMMESMIILSNTTIAVPELDPGIMLEAANNLIHLRNTADMFVTVWLGVLDLNTGLLRAASAGHEYPAIKAPDGKYELLMDKHGFVLGTLEDMKYESYELQLEPGTRLFLYTDGVPEATSSDDELFGTDRMLEALNSEPDASPAKAIKNVKMAIDMFVEDAPQFDDLTMLSFEYRGGYTGKKEKEEKKPAGRRAINRMPRETYWH